MLKTRNWLSMVSSLLTTVLSRLFFYMGMNEMLTWIAIKLRTSKITWPMTFLYGKYSSFRFI
jgi:hypothetical protein